MKKKTELAQPNASTLSLPPTAPPPRKEDIINAMVERARIKHSEEVLKFLTKRNAAKEALDEAIMLELQNNPKAFESSIDRCYSNRISVLFDCRVIPPHLKKLQDAYNNIPCLGSFDAATVRRKIREQYSKVGTGDRVKALLSNPEAVKALDAALERIA